MKAYIISFYDEDVSGDELVSFLDTKRDILNWVQPLPNTVFVVSNRSARYLARLIDKKYPQSVFIVAEYVPDNSDGMLMEDIWEFLNNPEAA